MSSKCRCSGVRSDRVDQLRALHHAVSPDRDRLSSSSRLTSAHVLTYARRKRRPPQRSERSGVRSNLMRSEGAIR